MKHYSWTFTTDHRFVMALLQVVFNLCAYDVVVNQYSDDEMTIDCTLTYGVCDIADQIEQHCAMPSSYFSFDAVCTLDGVAEYYRIANYHAFTDDITRLIEIDA